MSNLHTHAQNANRASLPNSDGNGVIHNEAIIPNQPAEQTVQEACCPGESQGMQTESCTMDGCDCTIDSKPTQQEDAPAVITGKAPTLDVPLTADNEQPPSLDNGSPSSDNVLISRDRGPPKKLLRSGNGLRAPPSKRA